MSEQKLVSTHSTVQQKYFSLDQSFSCLECQINHPLAHWSSQLYHAHSDIDIQDIISIKGLDLQL